MRPVAVLVFLTLCCSCAADLDLIFTGHRLPVGMEGASALYDGDDSIYIVAGWAGFSQPAHDQVIKYSLSSGVAENIGQFVNDRHGSALLTAAGDILYFGYASRNITAFNIRTHESRVVGLLPTPMDGMGLAWDSASQVGHFFGGRTGPSTYIDTIHRYNAADHSFEPVSAVTLPDTERVDMATVWDTRRQVAYTMGGWMDNGDAGRDIFEYTPPSAESWPNITRIGALLDEQSMYYSQAIYVHNLDEVYLFGVPTFANEPKHMLFRPYAPAAVEAIRIQGWPNFISFFATVYVPKLNRIYMFGGWGNLDGTPQNKLCDEIWYIDMPTESTPTTTARPPPVDCSDGETRLVADPSCCDSCYLCFDGEAIKMMCDEGQQFNPNTARCEDAAVVMCGITYGVHV